MERSISGNGGIFRRLLRRARSLNLASLAALLIFSAIPVAAAAQRNEANGDTESLNAFYGDRIFKGEGSKQDTYFEIATGTRLLPGSALILYYSHSPTLLPDYSSMTVSVDDIPLETVALTAANVKETLLRLSLSEMDLQPGIHKISVATRMKVSTAYCEDPQNSSAWLVASDKSKIELRLARTEDGADLRLYPRPYVERGTTNPVRAILAVPNEISEAEFKAAARLSAFFAAQSNASALNIPIYPESELTEALLRDHPVIWLGAANRWNGQGKTAAAELFDSLNVSAQPPGGLIGVAKLPESGLPNLFVMGPDDALSVAADMLTTELLYKQLSGTSSEIPPSLASFDKEAGALPEQGYVRTLEQLGYGNLVTEDVLEGGSAISYAIPNNLDLTNGATLHLVYKHSASVLFDKSVMTVKLNGVPIHSVKLQESTSERGEIDVRLDPTIIGSTRTLFVEIGFQFVNPNLNDKNGNATTFCADTLLGDWALIDKSSYFTFTPVRRTAYNLDSLPFPFVTGEDWNATTFVLASKDATTLGTAMTLLSGMRTPVEGNADVRLMDASDANLPAELRDRNIVYVGNAASLPSQLNGYSGSYVSFAGGSIKSISDNVDVMPGLARNAAVMQLTASPLNGDRSLLLLTATREDLLPLIGRAMTNPLKAPEIIGRIAVFDSDGNVHAFAKTVDSLAAEPPPAERTVAGTRLLPYGKWVFAGVFVLVVAALIAILRINRRKSNDDAD